MPLSCQVGVNVCESGKNSQESRVEMRRSPIGRGKISVATHRDKVVLNQVPTAPSQQVRPLSRMPSFIDKHMDFLQSCSPSLPTPVKDHIKTLVSAVETANARNMVLELENKGLRDAGRLGRGPRAGSRWGTSVRVCLPLKTC